VRPQRETIVNSGAKLTDAVIDAVVKAEQDILTVAASEPRTFPYRVKVLNGAHEVASETVSDASMRNAIIRGDRVDGPTWIFTGYAQDSHPLDNLTMWLESGAEVIRQVVTTS
jgi:hypothetical protein